MAESIRNKTVKGVGWSFADNMFNQGITFLVGLVLARLLTPEEYGLIGLITIFISVFNSIVDSGFSNALIRKTNVQDKDFNTAFLTNLVVSVFLYLILYIWAPAISRFFDQPMLISLLRVMGVIVIINAFGLIQRTIYIRNVDFKTQAKISLWASVLSGVTGIVMAYYGLGVWSLVGQQVSRQFLQSFLMWCYSNWYPKIQFSMQSFRDLFGFGWKLLVSGLINTVWNEIYQVVIGKFYSADTLGQYTRAHQFTTIFSSNLTGIVQRVSYPVLSQIQDDKQRLKNGYKRVIKCTMLISFCCMLGLAAIAEPMVLTLIGEQWLPCVPFLQLISFQMMLYPLHAINLNMLQVQGRSDLFLKLEIIKKIIAIGPLLLGIFIDVYLMLIGSILTGFISYYLNAFYSGKFLNYSIWEQIKDILPSFGIASVMAVMVYAISFINVSPILLLTIQLFAAFIIVFILCEITKLDSYLELKEIALSYKNKLTHGK